MKIIRNGFQIPKRRNPIPLLFSEPGWADTHVFFKKVIEMRNLVKTQRKCNFCNVPFAMAEQYLQLL